MRFSATMNVTIDTAPASEDDVWLRWYDKAEYRSFRKEVGQTILKMRRHSNRHDFGIGDDNLLCSRGLEHLLSDAHLQRKKMNKDVLVNALLAELSEQKEQGSYDPERLRNVSEVCSERAVVEAVSLGMSDAEEVTRIRIADIAASAKENTVETRMKRMGTMATYLFDKGMNTCQIRKTPDCDDKSSSGWRMPIVPVRSACNAHSA